MDEVKSISNRILVCGGGHQGLSMAAHLALNGENVVLWNRTEEHILKVKDSGIIYCDGIINGAAKIEKATSKMCEAKSDLIMVTVPSNAHADVAKVLAPYVRKDTVVILNPGRTFGAIDFALQLKKLGVKEIPHIAETQTIVYTCRKKSEDSTTIFAMKNGVGIASLKKDDMEYIMNRLPKCLKEYFSPQISVAITSFANVGMILHCAPVLMNIGWIENEKVDFKYYYDGISKSIARFLEKLDAERIHVAKECGYCVETTEAWLKRTYQVQGKSLYECIRENQAYREIDAPPTIENSRYILEDVPNGLVPIENLGKQLHIETPNISIIINLANAIYDADFRKLGRIIPKEVLKQYF